MTINTGNQPDISTGNVSTKTPLLARESGKAAKPSNRARTRSANANSSQTLAEPSTQPLANLSNEILQTLADTLSLLQQDLHEYNKALAKHFHTAADLRFNGKGGVIVLIAPPGHTLGCQEFDTGKHITLDGVPVTGWSPEKVDTGSNTDTGNKEGTGNE